ncbi:MAG: hypothetical protein WA431_04630 [Candidatus Cybelea sp.]
MTYTLFEDILVPWYEDSRFEWDEDDSESCRERTGLDFHAAKTIFSVDYLEREAETETGIPVFTATGPLRDTLLVTVIYLEVEARKRILDAFKADHEDILDYMLTYGI